MENNIILPVVVLLFLGFVLAAIKKLKNREIRIATERGYRQRIASIKGFRDSLFAVRNCEIEDNHISGFFYIRRSKHRFPEIAINSEGLQLRVRMVLSQTARERLTMNGEPLSHALTSIMGRHYGYLDDEQAEWLLDVIEEFQRLELEMQL